MIIRQNLWHSFSISVQIDHKCLERRNLSQHFTMDNQTKTEKLKLATLVVWRKPAFKNAVHLATLFQVSINVMEFIIPLKKTGLGPSTSSLLFASEVFCTSQIID